MLPVAVIFFLCFSQILGADTNSNSNTRIIDGELSSYGQFPYVVGFHYDKNGVRSFCAGSLISNRYVLTAAHCIVDASDFTIYIGTNNWLQVGTNGLVVTSTSYVAHPDYQASTLANNIGLILLPSAVEFTNNIQPIELATGSLGSSVQVTVVGWGATNDVEASPSNVQYHVSLATISNLDCMQTYQSVIRETMVCATGLGNRGTCRGDSGGPLIQTGTDGKSIHVGVAIFHSGAGCETEHPSGFTRTFEYTPWIRNVTGTTAPPPSGSSATRGALVVPVMILVSVLLVI